MLGINVNSPIPPEASRETYLRLTEVLRDVFDNDDVTAMPDLTAAQVEGWDSMGNVRLYLAVEMAFGVRFGSGEIVGMKNVGELARLIEQKRAR
jgi:acyl carrier protein